MAWTPFSAEAIKLEAKITSLKKQGRTSDVITAIVEALEKAHQTGPSNISPEDFEAELNKPE